MLKKQRYLVIDLLTSALCTLQLEIEPYKIQALCKQQPIAEQSILEIAIGSCGGDFLSCVGSPAFLPHLPRPCLHPSVGFRSSPARALRVTDCLIFEALLSVYDKANLLDLASGLHSAGVRLLGSGGTAKKIREAGIPIECVERSCYAHRPLTVFPEMFRTSRRPLRCSVVG